MEEDVEGLGAISIYLDELWNSLTLVFEPVEIDSILKRIERHLSGVEILEAGLIPSKGPASSEIEVTQRITLSLGGARKASTHDQILLKSHLSFGSGHHPTTACCIRLMEKAYALRSLPMVLDMGTGSGVLALCAVKLGAERVVGVDISHVACKEALENVNLNQVAGKILLVCGSVEAIRQKGIFDLLLANLTVGTLRSLGPSLVPLTKTQGLMIVSGFATTQLNEVIKTFTACRLLAKTAEKGWAALLLERFS